MEKEAQTLLSPLADQLATLGHSQRLALFRLMVRRYPDQVPAGELGASLGVKPSTLSSYLASLQRAGLITQTRHGTSLLYTAELDAVRRMFDGLLGDCCANRPDLCFPMPQGAMTVANRHYNVLFICTGNSARSIFAETLLRDLGGERFIAYSAGTTPHSELNPFAVKVLKDKGHDVSPLYSKNVAEFTGPDAPQLDFVFTVCNTAANEVCPPWEGQPVSGHWGMPDPVKATGTDAEKALAFQQAYGALRRRIEAFVALPVESLDRIALQTAIDDIAKNHKDFA
ncbi:helix-turn-helix domain-containing protein [Maritimibacter sp. DP1N21-5]|uniref:arsenate reductase/protein-tyrosine-phosphatase family protein n=1 Tax=Maritimibacter sp. DP1N21-5 TaxID=2836867 RepID=UPI001C4760B3|nr:helix-turn-helix domain-containing protein [Maritimibacter sp. DP1N21-5]MBV7407800.1 helix-turn-helix domain-containing protein [Maritimibacter sp. DP1N21-5]